MAYTPDQVQALYFKNEAEDAELAKRHEAERAVFSKRRDALKAWMLNYLNENNLQSANTEHGNFHKRTATSVTVDPDGGWDRLLPFVIGPALARFATVLENGGTDDQGYAAALEAPELGFLNRSVNKTAVQERLEQHPEFNPSEIGVKLVSVVQLGVRKA